MIDDKELETRFSYHAPHGDQVARYKDLRDKGWEFADMLVDNCPASRELALALTKLEEVGMWANASIARREAPVDTIQPILEEWRHSSLKDLGRDPAPTHDDNAA